jgi:hypothetical protein
MLCSIANATWRVFRIAVGVGPFAVEFVELVGDGRDSFGDALRVHALGAVAGSCHPDVFPPQRLLHSATTCNQMSSEAWIVRCRSQGRARRPLATNNLKGGVCPYSLEGFACTLFSVHRVRQR